MTNDEIDFFIESNELDYMVYSYTKHKFREFQTIFLPRPIIIPQINIKTKEINKPKNTKNINQPKESNACAKRTASVTESLLLLKESGLPVCEVFDVGVLHSTPALIEVFGDKRHHLFEPIDDYFQIIRSNYANIQHCLVHAAIADKNSQVMLNSAKKFGNDEISHSWITDTPSSTSRSVPMMTLDSYIEKVQPQAPFFLKIDVDGAPVPAAILRGATRTLEQCSAVMIEMTVERFFERAALLDAAGFDLWDIAALCYYGQCLWQFDAVYVKRSYKASLPNLQPIHIPPFEASRWQQG